MGFKGCSVTLYNVSSLCYSLKEYWELLEKLKTIKAQGYIKTHRAGPTGIGKTLEDLLGIPENNIPGPNGAMIELKSTRKNSKSMITLFTKSPSPPSANSMLLRKFGYPSSKGNDRKELHTTVNAVSFNMLKGRTGLKIEIEAEKLRLIGLYEDGTARILAGDRSSEMFGYWTREVLRESFEKKLPRLLYVKADCRVNGAIEEFWYNEAWLLDGFSFENFVRLLKEGIILVDIRIGQYPDGRPHDHGTAFRISPDKLDLCFIHREKVL